MINLNFVLIALQAMTEREIQALITDLGFRYQAAVLVAVLAVVGIVAVVITWFVYEHWFTPTESKELRTAFRKKFALILLGGDDGFADFKPAVFSGPEGILETRSIGRTGEHYTGALPRPKEFDESDLKEKVDETNEKIKDSAKKKDLAKTVAAANYVSMLANRRLLLRGARVPVWIAYRGKAVLTSLYGLVALQILDGMSKIEEFKEVFAAVDIVAIKSLFSEQWNESQLNAQETDKERKGELKAKRFAGKESLIMLFGVMIVFIVVVILVIVVAYFFGGGGGS